MCVHAIAWSVAVLAQAGTPASHPSHLLAQGAMWGAVMSYTASNPGCCRCAFLHAKACTQLRTFEQHTCMPIVQAHPTPAARTPMIPPQVLNGLRGSTQGVLRGCGRQGQLLVHNMMGFGGCRYCWNRAVSLLWGEGGTRPNVPVLRLPQAEADSHVPGSQAFLGQTCHATARCCCL